MVDLLVFFNWTYVSLIHSEGSYGETGAKAFRRYARDNSICIAVDRSVSTRSTSRDYVYVTKDLIANKEARVVILFAHVEPLLGLFQAIDDAGYGMKFQFIGTDSFHSNALALQHPGMLGAIAFTPKFNVSKEFVSYYKSLHPGIREHNPWFRDYWELYFNCSWDPAETKKKTCDPDERVDESNGYKEHPYTTAAINAVLTFANALDKMLKEYGPCRNVSNQNLTQMRNCITGPLLFEYMKNLTFQGILGETIRFDENGDPIIGAYEVSQIQYGNRLTLYEFAKLGLWSTKCGGICLESSIQWYLKELTYDVDDKENIPESVCSKPCSIGHYYIQREMECCWDCKKCLNYEIVINNATDCRECPLNYWPDDTDFLSCVTIEPTYLRWEDTLGIILTCLAVLGLGCVILVSVFFVRHRGEQLIKACSRELTAIMLVGITFGFTTVLVHIEQPTPSSCVAKYMCFNLSLVWVFAPILTRANRIYRIFDCSSISTEPPRWISPKAQIIITFILIAIEVSGETASTQ